MRRPAPKRPPFVKVGDAIQEGKVVCIVEAMKLMNEIEADASGDVVRVLVENGQPVEYGQPLFAIRPTQARHRQRRNSRPYPADHVPQNSYRQSR